MAEPAKGRQVAAEAERARWRYWALGTALVLLAIVVAQNSQEVRVEILFGEFNAPLILVLLIAAALGAVIGYAAPLVRRGRREERRSRGP